MYPSVAVRRNMLEPPCSNWVSARVWTMLDQAVAVE